MTLLPPRLVTAAAVAALAVAYAWFATGLYPFTWPAVAATMTAGAAVLMAARRRGTPVRAREANPPVSWAGTVVWVVLLLALGAWELAAFLQHPRPDHPTLSALANGVFNSHLVRALSFLAWLGAGAGLARR